MTQPKTTQEIDEEKTALRADIARCDSYLALELPENERKYHEHQRNLAIARLWSLGSTTKAKA